MRLNIKLVNHRPFIQTSEGLGENEVSEVEEGTSLTEEPLAAMRWTATSSASSRAWGSGWRDEKVCVTNVDTMAEKREA